MKADKPSRKFLSKSSGRIHLLTLAIIVFFAGLFFDQWWWKIGGIVILVIFVEAYFKYRTLD